MDALLNLRLVKDRLIAGKILLHDLRSVDIQSGVADNGTDRNGENAEVSYVLFQIHCGVVRPTGQGRPAFLCSGNRSGQNAPAWGGYARAVPQLHIGVLRSW